MLKSHLLFWAAFVSLPLTAQATSVAYRDDEDLWASADVVMVANVWRFDEDFDRTLYELEALECFKGCRAGDFVMMYSPGVSPKRESIGLHETIPGAPHPNPNDRLIVHLKKHADGSFHLMSLGLSMYTMRYNTTLKRYIAHRETDTLFIVKPTSAPARAVQAVQDEALVAADTFASDVIAQLRKKAAR